jgi:hypothetical protein
VAYSFGTPTVDYRVSAGRRYCIVTVSETGAGASSEATLAGVPECGKIVSVVATKTAGAGATIDPEIGRAAAWADGSQDEVWQNGTAAAHIDQSPERFYFSPTGTLFLRSSVNAAADNAITTQIIIQEGV